jgi:RNA polymerase sigma factor (sigma-70 family)
MANRQPGKVLQHLRRLAGGQPAGELSDRQLLQRFTLGHEEAALAALVQRHGPLVRGVCRRLVANEHDADDVFQATFLVLVCKAGSIRKADSLGSWLHGVAYRIARKAQASAAKRQRQEKQTGSTLAPDPAEEAARRELRRLLDEELGRLPEKYRAPLVLCYLEGKSHEEAARHLRWPNGTVCGRLARARELLRGRLAHRGLALSAGLFATLLAEEQGSAAVPGALLIATLKSTGLIAAGTEPAAGVLPPQVAALTQGVLRAIAVSRLKAAALLLLAGSILAAAAAGLAQPTGAPRPPQGRDEGGPQPPTKDAGQAGAERTKAGTDLSGDPLPAGTLARLGTARFRHGAAVRAVAYSGSGKVIASAGDDHMIYLWDAGTGKLLRPLQGHSREVTAIAFSPDGRTLASGSMDTAVCLWDTATGKKLRQIGAGKQGSVASVSFSPGGRRIAAGSYGGTIRIWEVATGKSLQQLRGGPDEVLVAFSPRGQILASSPGDNSVRLWDLAAGKELRRLRGAQKRIASLAFSPDGKTLAAGGEAERRDQAISLWEVASGKELRRLAIGGVKALAFSPDGQTLAAGGYDSAIRLWDVAGGKEVRQLARPVGNVTSLAFSPDGRALAWGSEYKTVHQCDVVTGKELRPLVGHQGTVTGVAFSPDGQTVISASFDGVLCLWQTGTGRPIRRLEGHRSGVCAVAFAPDGRAVASAGCDGDVIVWDVRTGKELCRCRGHRTCITTVAFSPDGRTLASAGGDTTVRLWEAATGKELRKFTGHRGWVSAVAFSPDGKAVASAGVGFFLWEAATGKIVRSFPGHEFAVNRITFSPDGRTLASASSDKTVRLGEVLTGQERGRLLGHRSEVVALAFSPDGRTLASGSGEIPFYPRSEGEARAVRLWDVATGKELGRLGGHRGGISALAFGPDGTKLASGSSDTTGLVWDVTRLVRGGQPAPAPLAAEDLEGLWAGLADQDARKAYQAIWSLARAPRQSVPWLQKQLRPVVVPADLQRRMARLLADLDDSRFAVRQKATAELEKLGEVAAPALRQALSDRLSVEARQRVERILEKLAASPEALRPLRALEALELVGSRPARQVIQTLAQGMPEARLTQEAKGALKRLAHRN